MKQIQSNPANGLSERKAYTVEEAARLLGCHKVSVYRRIYSGEIKILKGFGRLMIPASEMDRFVGEVTEYTPRRQRGHAARQVKKETTPTTEVVT